MAVVDTLCQYYVGYCPLHEVRYINTIFRELAVLRWVIGSHYSDRFLIQFCFILTIMEKLDTATCCKINLKNNEKYYVTA